MVRGISRGPIVISANIMITVCVSYRNFGDIMLKDYKNCNRSTTLKRIVVWLPCAVVGIRFQVRIAIQATPNYAN